VALPIVAVTGATGFIGQRLIRTLVEDGYDVRALARRIPPGAEITDAVAWIKGSLTDDGALRRLLNNVTAVVHCAGCVKALDRETFYEVNGAATRRLAELAAAQPTPPRFVLMSSLAAREPRLSAYAASKRAGEQAVNGFRDRLPVVILRPPAVYGPGDLETLKVFRMAARGFVVAPSNASARASLVHVEDVARAVSAALRLEHIPDVPIEFDDGTPGAYSWSDIAAAAGAALRTTPRVLPVPAPVVYLAGALATIQAWLTRRPGVLSWGKVPELLHSDWVSADGAFPGYKPLWNIEKGFKDTVAWYTSQGLLTT
jgi:nucleoside-diphosphate-sugar epimerase